MSKGFRLWYYFRTGWSNYFAFIFAAINTIIATYYLAIENIGSLKEIFSTFELYFLTFVLSGVPILTISGYYHFKRSQAFKSEADVQIETNPHIKKLLINTEIIMKNIFTINNLIIKKSTNISISDKDVQNFSVLNQHLKKSSKNRTIHEQILTDIDKIISSYQGNQ